MMLLFKALGRLSSLGDTCCDLKNCFNVASGFVMWI